MENQYRDNTKAKIALFVALGVLGTSYYRGNQSLIGNKQGEVNFASYAAESKVDELEVLRSIPLVNGSEYRDDKEERKITDTLVEMFKELQEKNGSSNGELNRATHNKGTCFNGDFRILSDDELSQSQEFKSVKSKEVLIQKLRRGIYKDVDQYDAQIRFANADGMGRHQDDKEKDVRAMSFSLDLKNNFVDYTNISRQDFNANSTPMFAVNNIKEFLGLMEIVMFEFSNPNWKKTPIESGAGIVRILNNNRNDNLSYATEAYWGNVPFTHGMKENGEALDLVKFKIAPCDGKLLKENSDGKDENFLQTEIKERARKFGVCFNYQLQFFDIAKLREYYTKNHNIIKLAWTRKMWVENGGAEWPEEAAPFYTIAKLEIPKGSESVDCKDRYINPRLHSNRDNMPIGSLARVRAEVELMSKQRRMNERKD